MNASLEWDYSALATHYHLRAPYADAAFDDLFARLRLPRDCACVDVGAGSGRLTAELVARGFAVIALEPNAGMRAIGSAAVPAARWIGASAQDSTLENGCCDLLTFGSSFNVVPPRTALDTAARLLRPRGWLVVLWNHRDLQDPLQARLQHVIERFVPDYAHGSRRDDPSATIEADARFGRVERIDARFVHRVPARDFVEGFRAHATLVRQAAGDIDAVIEAMHAVVADAPVLDVPFTTRVYAAPRREP